MREVWCLTSLSTIFQFIYEVVNVSNIAEILRTGN
jgi:hypothetical protein